MTHFTQSVHKLETDLLQSRPLGLSQQRLPQSNDPLLCSDDTSLYHQKVTVDLPIMRETSHWSDGLVCQVVLSARVVLHDFAVLDMDASSNPVDLLVYLCSMSVSLLSCSGDSELDSRGMPGSNAGHLPETFVGLSRQFLAVPSGGDSLEAVAFRDSNAVNEFVLRKDRGDRDTLFQVSSGKVDLLADCPTIYLDLHDMGLLLSFLEQLHLSVSDDSDDRAVLGHPLEVSVNLLPSQRILPFSRVFREGLLL